MRSPPARRRAETTNSRCATDEFPFAGYGGYYPPEPDTAKIDAVQARLEEVFAPFDIAFVRERPTSGEYMMVVLSPDWAGPGPDTGLAQIDCSNLIEDDVAIVTTYPGAQVVANLAGSAIGRNFGLNHSLNEDDMSYGLMGGNDRTWLDTCSELWSNDTQVCALSHDDYCPAGFENTYQELLARIGPAQ